MVRAHKIRKSAVVTPKRQNGGRKRFILKATQTNKKRRKSQPQAQKLNIHKNKLRQGRTTSPMTPRTSRRLTMNFPRISRTQLSGNIHKAKLPAATIVIEDTDEENEPNISNMQCNPIAIFYEDRSPGLRDMQVPLYETNLNTVEGDGEIYDTTIIELDSTVDNSQEISPGILCDGQPQSSSAVNLSEHVKRLPSTVASMIPSTNMIHVIDLSDDSDDASQKVVSASVQNIPLGYKIVKPLHNTNRLSKNQKPKNSKSPKKTSKNSPPVSFPPCTASSSVAPTLNQHQSNSKAIECQSKRMIIIDGNNVAYGHLNGNMFSVKGLDLCIRYFKKLGHEVVAVVPQYKLKKKQSTDQELLQMLHRQGDVILAPSKNLPGQYSSPYDDRLIMSVAEKFDGVIISNDNFRDLLDTNPAWRRIIETRVIGYTWVKDCFFLPDDPYGRHGPSLLAMLNGYSA